MQTVQYLKQISKLNRLVNKKMVELEEMKSLVYGLSAVKLEERVQTSPDFDKIGACIAKLEGMSEKLNELIDEYIDTKTTIIEQIESFIDEEEIVYEVLYSRYIEGDTFEKIAVKQNYSYRHIRRIHTKAINSFHRKYGYLYENK